MAKFGSFKYGGGAEGAQYGTGDGVEYLTWHFEVFWDDAFVDEGPLMIGAPQVERGRDHLLATGGQGWQRFGAGQATGTFDNSDGRFDPYNSSSPLYGFLLPGRVVRISVEVQPPYLNTTTTYPILRGIIDDIQTFIRGGRRLARIVVKDGLEWLARRSIALALTQDAETLVTAAAIAAQVGFDNVDDWTITQLGTDSIEVPFAFGNDGSALNLINQFVDAEGGIVFHAADGTLVFVANDYTQATTTDIDQAQALRDIELRAPWEVVRTRAQVTARPMAEGAPEVLWTFGVDNNGASYATTSIYIPATLNTNPPNSATIDAIFASGGASTSPSIDFYDVRTAGFLPPGADVPSNLDLTTEDIGTGLRLTFTQQAGEHEWHYFITWIEITANPIVAEDQVVITVQDSTAITTYGEKTFTLDVPWIQEPTYAQAYADWIVSELKNARLFPTIKIENRSALQFAPDLYIDKIHLTIAALGIDDTFRIGKISHRSLNDNGFAIETTFKLEPVLGFLTYTPPPEV